MRRDLLALGELFNLGHNDGQHTNTWTQNLYVRAHTHTHIHTLLASYVCVLDLFSVHDLASKLSERQQCVGSVEAVRGS